MCNSPGTGNQQQVHEYASTAPSKSTTPAAQCRPALSPEKLALWLTGDTPSDDAAGAAALTLPRRAPTPTLAAASPASSVDCRAGAVAGPCPQGVFAPRHRALCRAGPVVEAQKLMDSRPLYDRIKAAALFQVDKRSR